MVSALNELAGEATHAKLPRSVDWNILGAACAFGSWDFKWGFAYLAVEAGEAGVAHAHGGEGKRVLTFGFDHTRVTCRLRQR